MDPNSRKLEWTWPVLFSALTALASIIGGWLVFESHFVTAAEARQRWHQIDIKVLWLQHGTIDNRRLNLEDHVFDLAAKKQGTGLSPAEEASFQRYQAQLNDVTAQSNTVKAEIYKESGEQQ